MLTGVLTGLRGFAFRQTLGRLRSQEVRLSTSPAHRQHAPLIRGHHAPSPVLPIPYLAPSSTSLGPRPPHKTSHKAARNSPAAAKPHRAQAGRVGAERAGLSAAQVQGRGRQAGLPAGGEREAGPAPGGRAQPVAGRAQQNPGHCGPDAKPRLLCAPPRLPARTGSCAGLACGAGG